MSSILANLSVCFSVNPFSCKYTCPEEEVELPPESVLETQSMGFLEQGCRLFTVFTAASVGCAIGAAVTKSITLVIVTSAFAGCAACFGSLLYRLSASVVDDRITALARASLPISGATGGHEAVRMTGPVGGEARPPDTTLSVGGEETRADYRLLTAC